MLHSSKYTHYPYLRRMVNNALPPFSPFRNGAGDWKASREDQIEGARLALDRLADILLALEGTDTLCIITADHGECFGEDGLCTTARCFTKRCLRSRIVRWSYEA